MQRVLKNVQSKTGDRLMALSVAPIRRFGLTVWRSDFVFEDTRNAI